MTAPRRIAMVLSNDFLSDPRVEKEALALVGAGYDVSVIAWGRSGTAQREESRNGIRIIRVGPSAAYGSGLKNVMGFRHFWKEAHECVVAMRPDIVHCHDLDTASVGMSARKVIPDLRFVLDLHEVYPESNMMPKKPLVAPVARALARRIERRAIEQADLVVLANPGFASVYETMASGKIAMVENAPDLNRFAPVGGSQEPGVFRVCYIGQKRYPESLRTLMDAIQSDTRLHAYIAGGGSAEAQVARMAKEYDRIEIEGRLDYADIPSRYQRCDAVYVAYDSSIGNLRLNLPVKVMEGMACALPVLAGAGTWAGDYVERHGIGFALEVADPDAVSRALIQLADDSDLAREMGRAGRVVVEREMNWQAASGRLLAGYADLPVRD